MAVVFASAKQASILVTLGVFFNLSIDVVDYFEIAIRGLLSYTVLKTCTYTKSFKMSILFLVKLNTSGGSGIWPGPGPQVFRHHDSAGSSRV